MILDLQLFLHLLYLPLQDCHAVTFLTLGLQLFFQLLFSQLQDCELIHF